MQVYFTRLLVGWPDSVQKPPDDWDGCWKLFTICLTTDKRTCTTRADVKSLGLSDQRSARLTFISFTNKAHTGQPLSELYDEKKCHEAHSFSVSGTEVKIFRIWGSGKIRVYFLYLTDKNIVFLKTKPKREDQLSAGEKLELETIARNVLESLKANTFISRLI